MPQRLWTVCLAMLVAVALAAPAGATSYLPVADETLVEQARLVVVASVRSSGPAAAPGAPATEHVVEVERVLKGRAAASMLTVRVPGGVRPDGSGRIIWGAPAFAPDDRAILFLSPRPDGTWGILHLMLGAFHEVIAGGQRLALRDLAEARAVAVPGKAAAPEPVRDFERFAEWIAARARGRAPAIDYLAAPPASSPVRIGERFSFLVHGPTGRSMRWFEFESGISVPMLAHQSGQAGVAGGGFAEFQAAIAAWNDVPGTTVDYVYGGTTAAAGGFSEADGVNAILFGDPNEDIFDAFVCGEGGILAIGGPAFIANFTGTFDGQTFIRILEADIVTNDGIECFLVGPNAAKTAEGLFGHELGHTLGLGHSCDTDSSTTPPSCFPELLDEALMRWSIHNDGRGAQLNDDDRAGLAALYATQAPPPPSAFFTVTPCRLVDTRLPDGPYGGPSFAAGFGRTFDVAGQCQVPATAVAVALNVTVVGPQSAGHLALGPGGPPPATSTVNFGAGQVRANNAVVRLSDDASRALSALVTMPAGAVHVIIDVNGYFEPAPSAGSASREGLR